MKQKYAAVVAVIVAVASLTTLAQKQVPAGRVFLVKAGGRTIAELRLRQDVTFTVEGAGSSSRGQYDKTTGMLVATGGVTLKLSAGTNSISVRADEIESVPDTK